MIRNAIGGFFLFLSGMFVYIVGYFSFSNVLDVGPGKLPMLLGFCIPLILCHLIGLLFYKGSNWKTLTGKTLLIAGIANLVIVIMVWSVTTAPEMADVKGIGAYNVGDVALGCAVMAITLGLGAALYYLGNKHAAA